MSTDPKMVHPWCGGCGHNFFRESMIPMDQAMRESKTRRCHYCKEDEEDLKRNPPRASPAPEPDNHEGFTFHEHDGDW